MAVRELDDEGSLVRIIPELEEGRGFAQPSLHYFDVLDHNVAAVEAVDGALFGPNSAWFRESLSFVDIDEALAEKIDGFKILTLTRLACLVHDVAKPRTATMKEGRLRFPRHGPVGAEILEERLPAIGLPDHASEFVARLVRQHLRPAELIRNQPPTPRAVHRFVASVDGHVLPLMILNLADGWATGGPGYSQDNYRRHCAFAAYVLRLCADAGETAE